MFSLTDMINWHRLRVADSWAMSSAIMETCDTLMISLGRSLDGLSFVTVHDYAEIKHWLGLVQSSSMISSWNHVYRMTHVTSHYLQQSVRVALVTSFGDQALPKSKLWTVRVRCELSAAPTETPAWKSCLNTDFLWSDVFQCQAAPVSVHQFEQ